LGAIGIIPIIVIYFYFVRRIIMWWPSGWMATGIILVIFLLFSNRKLKVVYLRKKYGPGPGKELVRSYGDKVYLLINDKTKRWIKNKETLFELGYDWDQIKWDMGPGELSKYKEDSPISI